MTVLVTGSTGTVGSEVTRHLVDRGADVRALTRHPDDSQLPPEVSAVGGELTDVDAMRKALDGVSSLFLLSPVSLDELTGSLITVDLARNAGVRNVVYLSVMGADTFTDPPHFAAKGAVERMLADFAFSATVLRPGYYMQNDAAEKSRLLDDGIYGPPVGNKGVLMTDVRDLGEVAALELLRRDGAEHALDGLTLDVANPGMLTGDSIAAVWAELLGRPVRYGGDDLDAFEKGMAESAPGWMAYDMRLMMRRFQRDGLATTTTNSERLQKILGRPMRSYREFAAELAADWTG